MTVNNLDKYTRITTRVQMQVQVGNNNFDGNMEENKTKFITTKLISRFYKNHKWKNKDAFKRSC